jgi:hypothetical protein
MKGLSMTTEATPGNVPLSDQLGLVATDAASVRRDLMALARRDTITNRDRATIGAAIGLIGQEMQRQAEVAELFARDCNTCAHQGKRGNECSYCNGRINWAKKA